LNGMYGSIPIVNDEEFAAAFGDLSDDEPVLR
jgi:hypothetical protein